MPVKVVTVSTCDRCGRTVEQAGKDGEIPQTWATCEIKSRGGADQDNQFILCLPCRRAVRDFIRSVPKDAPGPQEPAVDAPPLAFRLKTV